MDRRTALQLVAGIFAAVKGERIMAEQQTTGSALKFADFKIAALRIHLDPKIRLEVAVGDEVIEIDKAELLAALRKGK